MAERITKTSIEQSPDSSGWNTAAICQIYPRSFREVRETPADLRGEGSILGITEKLDELKEIGFDALWISPFFPSPMHDGGYDIKDYRDVDERYGNLAHFQELVEQAHERGMKLMIDFVPNHTSIEHPWFEESRSSKDNPRADWYIWRDAPEDGERPGNHASVFSLPQLRARQNGELHVPEGEPTPPISAWSWDETRQQYYYHSFLKEQPDLNWHHPAVREEMYDTIRFWIERGVDGFRIDAFNHAGKHPELPNETRSHTYKEGTDNPYDQLTRHVSANYLPALRQFTQEMTGVLDEYPERDLYMIFEAYAPNEITNMIDRAHPKKAASFYFNRFGLGLDAPSHARFLNEQYANIPAGGGANHVMSNHDKPLPVDQYGPLGARAMALVNLLLPNSQVYIYQKELGGDRAFSIPPEKVVDTMGERDDARTPMLWTPGKNAGFSETDNPLWLPLHPDYKNKNLERQKKDPGSSYSWYRTLLHMRRAWQSGTYEPFEAADNTLLGYHVVQPERRLTVLANFSDAIQDTAPERCLGRKALSSLFLEGQELEEENGIQLAPFEGAAFIQKEKSARA